MKKRKLNWYNIFRAVIMVLCFILIIHDFYCLIFKSWQWTYLGLFSFLIVAYIFADILFDFIDEIKSIPSDRPKYTKDTDVNN